MAGSIGHHHALALDLADIGNLLELDANDGLVGAQVHVRGVIRQLPVGNSGNTVEFFRLVGRGDIDRAVAARFLLGLDRPGAGDDEVGLGLLGIAQPHQVQRHDAVFANGPALQEQHAEIAGDMQQLAQVGDGLVVDTLELAAAVAHFHHRNPGPVP
ncbi:hypothetical protein D9M69_587790 [compost metagenome]